MVVPGHGGVASAAFTRLQRSEIDEVGKLARAAHAAGLDPGEAAESTDGPYPKPHMASAFRRVWPQLESP